MKRNPIVLAAAVLLFAGWLTWLGVQALGAKRPVIVSRAQLAISQYDVEADLERNPDGTLPKSIAVAEVRWSSDGDGPVKGSRIDVMNINSAQGFVARGTYLIPLVKSGKNYAVANLPQDTGYSGDPLPPRYYPATLEVMKQWDEARAP